MKNKLTSQVRGPILTSFKAALSLVPGGGVVSTLIDDSLGRETARATEEAFRQFGERLEELENRIDTDNVDTVDFSELLKRYLLTIQLVHRDQKLKAANEIILNCMLQHGDSEKLAYSELELFMDCVTDLPSGAFAVLGTIYGSRRDHPLRQFQGSHPARLFSLRLGSINRSLGSDDSSIQLIMARKLEASGLVQVDAPTVRGEGFGDASVALTETGLRFARHILRLAPE